MSEVGRPRVYSDEIASLICEQMGDGRSLLSILKADGMPARSTVYKWIDENYEGFADKYAISRERQAHALADELLEIADTPERGVTITTEADGSQKIVEGDMINHRRLRYDARKWLTSKILPKFYGEKVTQEVVGANGGPVQYEDVRAPIASLIAPANVKQDTGGQDADG
jgi:terminase small subunit-like protein